MTRRQFPDLSRFVQQLPSLGLKDVDRALQSLVGLPGQAPIGEPAASATYTPLTPATVQNRVAEALNPAWGPQVIGPTDRGVSVFRRTVAGSRWEEVKGVGTLACTPASAIKLFETNDETLIRTFNPLYDSGYDVQRFSASAKVAYARVKSAFPGLRPRDTVSAVEQHAVCVCVCVCVCVRARARACVRACARACTSKETHTKTQRHTCACV